MKSKVTKTTKMDKKDSYGNTSFIIEFENGDKGFFTSKEEDQTYFKLQAEAEYLIEEKSGANGNKYFKVTKPQSDKPAYSGNNSKQSIDPRAQFIGFSHAYAKDLLMAGKISLADLNKYSEEIFNNMLHCYERIKS